MQNISGAELWPGMLSKYAHNYERNTLFSIPTERDYFCFLFPSVLFAYQTWEINIYSSDILWIFLFCI